MYAKISIFCVSLGFFSSFCSKSARIFRTTQYSNIEERKKKKTLFEIKFLLVSYSYIITYAIHLSPKLK